MKKLSAVAASEEVVHPTLRGYLVHLGELAVFFSAFFGPMYAVSRFGWLDGPQSERIVYWKLFAIVAWYTLLAMAAAVRLLHRAWQIHRRGVWPDAGAFVVFPTVVRRDWWMRVQSASAVLLAAMVLSLLGVAWHTLDLPALFLAGYGDGIVGASDCPPATTP